MSLPPPPPALVDDAMREIFLRVPPDDPKSLLRAAAVCPTWRSLISDAAFARDYRAFHGAPPMLGFLYDECYAEEGPFHDMHWVSHFIPTASFRTPACEDRRNWHALDSRHGLVLFLTPRMDAELAVCDLVTSDQWRFRADPRCFDIMWWSDPKDERLSCNATVICAKERCDHRDCHGGPFRVALVGSEEDGAMALAAFYSSETGEWSEIISLELENLNYIHGPGHSAVVGDKVYVPCVESDSVVEYNMGGQQLSVIDAPFMDQEQPYLELMGVEDGMLLFATVLNSRLHLWSMAMGTHPNGAAAWECHRVIELQPLLPPPGALLEVSIVGFAEGVNVIFLTAKDGLHTIELNSGEIKKVHEKVDLTKVIPYVSFYT